MTTFLNTSTEQTGCLRMLDRQKFIKEPWVDTTFIWAD